MEYSGIQNLTYRVVLEGESNAIMHVIPCSMFFVVHAPSSEQRFLCCVRCGWTAKKTRRHPQIQSFVVTFELVVVQVIGWSSTTT